MVQHAIVDTASKAARPLAAFFSPSPFFEPFFENQAPTLYSSSPLDKKDPMKSSFYRSIHIPNILAANQFEFIYTL